MKFSSTEEYGLRCMLQMAKKGTQETPPLWSWPKRNK